MEKASLIVKTTKKGISVKVKTLKTGKIVPVQKFTKATLEMNGMEVEVLRENGQVVLIKDGEKTLFDSRNLSKVQKQPLSSSATNDDDKIETTHIEYVQDPAYAPYNFISLNNKVVKIDIRSDGNDKNSNNKNLPHGITFDAYHDSYHTGWIDIEIETITPIYIRGSEKNSDFYAPSGNPAIPGSSLRGMIRQLVEIVSFGKFGFFNDKKTLYYRGLADRTNLRNEYQGQMSSYDRNRKIAIYNVSAGIIRKKGLNYYIIPTTYNRIAKGKAIKQVTALGKKYNEFEFYDLKDSGEYLVVSGDMMNKKHDWLIQKAESKQIDKTITIPKEDINNYKNDTNRKILKDKNDNPIPSILNLIELLDEKIENEVPCFYTLWKDNQRVSFGHTAMFRLAYEKSIGDHVSKELTEDICDIAEGMFGNEKDFAGRLFFEDAMIEKKYNDIFFGEKDMKILSEPKPTTFQHYLVQDQNHIKERKHYNSNSSIRGNKIYWHKTGKDWEETNKENIDKYPKQYLNSKINPIRDGVKFSGRIRFENLLDIELGALLFTLELPDGCYHKIGMGKPLGLGSIKISSKLYLSDRQKRYEDLFAEWDNQVPESKNKYSFINQFENHVLEEIDEKAKDTLWHTERLKQLFTMLHYDTGVQLDKANKINYMDLQLFKNRSILPKPSQLADLKNIESLIERGLIDKIDEDVHTQVFDEKQNKDLNENLTDLDLVTEYPEYINKIEIDSLWNTYHIEWELNRDVNVLFGLNGSGKSTILRLIKNVLLNEPFVQEQYSKLPSMIKISYDKGNPSIYTGCYQLSEPQLDKLHGAILSKRIDEESKKIGSPTNIEDQKNIANFVQKEVAEKINLLQEWATKKIFFENQMKFLSELSNQCGNEWVELNKSELLSAFYVIDQKQELISVGEYVDVILIVTFDRYLPQKELEKITGDQSILDSDLRETHDNFRTQTNPDEVLDKIKILLEIMNTLFEDTGKKVTFNKESGLLLSKNGEPIDLLYLSSGEKQLIYILLKVFIGSIKNKPIILLMDEPEISLHVGWQLDFINHIRKLHENMQIIIASHSPAITFENWFNHEIQMHSIMELKNGTQIYSR